ncbi:putative histone lysine methyltransferase, SET [Toxoplasma gondii MAS]|uniref:Putative histone lysine methyltransferase, SET n=1 Tax=Toxoplasma gondii MAS TaxID=943118 RepID=A0A086QTA3_TOXGO|nr:putative histone lysine methyltransferase, SET [Toxoplasma gondii MAS]
MQNESSNLEVFPCCSGQVSSCRDSLTLKKSTEEDCVQTSEQNCGQLPPVSPASNWFIHPLLLPLLPSRFAFKNPSWPPTPKKKRNLVNGCSAPPPSLGVRGSSSGSSKLASRPDYRTEWVSQVNAETEKCPEAPAKSPDSNAVNVSHHFSTSSKSRKRRKVVNTPKKAVSNGAAAQADLSVPVNAAAAASGDFPSIENGVPGEEKTATSSESAICRPTRASQLSTHASSPSNRCQNDSPRLMNRVLTCGNASVADGVKTELECGQTDTVADSSDSSVFGGNALDEVTRAERGSALCRNHGNQTPAPSSDGLPRDLLDTTEKERFSPTQRGSVDDGEGATERPQQASSVRSSLTETQSDFKSEKTGCSPSFGFLRTSPTAGEISELVLSDVYTGVQTPSKAVKVRASVLSEKKGNAGVDAVEKKCGADATSASPLTTRQGPGKLVAIRWGEAPYPVSRETTPSRRASESQSRVQSSQSSRNPSKGPFLPSIGCGLVVSASSLGRGSGLGVYATRAYSARSRIGEYAGLCVDRKVAMMLRGMGTSTHVMRVGMQYQYLVGYRLPFVFGGAGAFVNDGRWFADGRKGPGVTARFHVAYDKKRAKDRVYVVATRDIAEGEEVFTSYDNQYWALLH